MADYSITFRCGVCGFHLAPAMCADLPALTCDRCGRTVQTETARWSCRVDVWVPTSNPYEAWRGYGHIVRDGVCRTCQHDDCRHAKAATAYLEKLCPSPDSPTPVPPAAPRPSPPTRARSGRVARTQ